MPGASAPFRLPGSSGRAAPFSRKHFRDPTLGGRSELPVPRPTSHTPPPQAGLEPRVPRRGRPPGRPAWLIFARPALRGQQAGHQGLGGNAVRGPGLSWEVSYRDRPAPLTPRPHPGDGGEGRATVCTQGLGPGLTWGWRGGSKGCRTSRGGGPLLSEKAGDRQGGRVLRGEQIRAEAWSSGVLGEGRCAWGFYFPLAS